MFDIVKGKAAATVVITIEDGIPLPPQTRGKGAIKNKPFKPTLPLSKLKVGQSMFVPDSVVDKKRLAARISSATKRTGRRYAMRLWQEGRESGVRIWHVD